MDGSTLSAEVKAHLVAQRAAHPYARILFVRRTERRAADGLVAFFARTGETQRELRRVELERYDDLLELELATAGEPLDHPLFLVCTHGKHDRCCSRFGRPLYDDVCEQVEDGWAWQSSHVGGDRFAGNLVCLPHGIYYGRVGRGDAVGVLDAHLEGWIAMGRYRGRSAHPFAAQAAERDVREATGLRGIDELRLRSTEVDGDVVHVVFEDVAGRGHGRVVRVELGPEELLTCHAEELRRPRRYVVSPA